jgi:L-cystine transport system substrate-binding protein
MKIWKKILTAVLAASLIAATAGCGSTSSVSSTASDDTASADDGVTVLRYAYRSPGLWPMGGEDENGNPTGYDIEMMRLVDEALPDISIEFIPTSYDDCYVGLEMGNFDVVDTSAFYTPERAERYNLPEESVGQTILYMIVRKENADVTSFEDLYDAGLQLSPITAGNGIYYVVDAYNQANPDKALELKTTGDSTYVGGSIEEVVNGKYDAALWSKAKFDSVVLSEDGELHSLLDQISYSAVDVAKTYPIFSKNVDESIVQEISDALADIKASGKAAELSLEFFGYNIFDLDSIDLG